MDVEEGVVGAHAQQLLLHLLYASLSMAEETGGEEEGEEGMVGLRGGREGTERGGAEEGWGLSGACLVTHLFSTLHCMYFFRPALV